MTRVLFLSCHLAGTGHLVRTLALARAVTAAGGRARILSGGAPVAHLDTAGADLVQLPPLGIRGHDYATMLTAEGTPADAQYMACRTDAIAAAIAAFAPDVLVTETFPLGRRRLAPEFERAIATARRANPDCAIVCSVRDVPEPPSKPARIAEAEARLARDYDRLLVHGEATFLPLDASWPLTNDLERMILHTGYVGTAALPAAGERGEEILVAAGGGGRGRALLDLAARAAALSPRPWRILVGGADAAAEAAALTARHPAPTLMVEPARRDYRALLARAACSVSLAGYNTAMDLAPLGTPAILAADEAGGEREQAIRAAALARFEGIALLGAGATPAALASLAETMAGRERPPLPIRLDGAARAADAILDLARARARA